MENRTEPKMKWYYFIIYFQLFANAVLSIINLLRQYANSEPYVKVSGKADSFLFDYLQKYVVEKDGCC